MVSVNIGEGLLSVGKILIYNYIILEVEGPSGPGLLAGGPPGPDLVLRALRALRPCDPRNNDWIVYQPLDSVLAVGKRVSRWIVC